MVTKNPGEVDESTSRRRGEDSEVRQNNTERGRVRMVGLRLPGFLCGWTGLGLAVSATRWTMWTR